MSTSALGLGTCQKSGKILILSQNLKGFSKENKSKIQFKIIFSNHITNDYSRKLSVPLKCVAVHVKKMYIIKFQKDFFS